MGNYRFSNGNSRQELKIPKLLQLIDIKMAILIHFPNPFDYLSHQLNSTDSTLFLKINGTWRNMDRSGKQTMQWN